MLYSFGREDQLDLPGIRRLVAALARLLDTDDAMTAAALVFTGSWGLGGVHVLVGLWRQLRIDTGIRGMRAVGRHDARVERILSLWRPTGPWRRLRSRQRPAGSLTT